MSITASEMTPADIAAVTNNGYGGGGFGGWGNDWWIILLFLFGWGRNGFGGGGGGCGCGSNSTCATPGDVTAAVDRQTFISKLDNQTYGLADATFALNNAITTGFANAELSRCNQQAAFMQQLFQLQSSMADCCCTTQRAIDGVNYNMAIQTSTLQHELCNGTRDIIDNQNCNARAILDALNAQRYEAKVAENQNLRDQLFMATLRESQSVQNGYLVNALKEPCARPAYIVPNPNAAYQYTVSQQSCCNPCSCCG